MFKRLLAWLDSVPSRVPPPPPSPCPPWDLRLSDLEQKELKVTGGNRCNLTVRDHFAEIAAREALLSTMFWWDDPDQTALRAYRFADAMIKRRSYFNEKNYVNRDPSL